MNTRSTNEAKEHTLRLGECAKIDDTISVYKSALYRIPDIAFSGPHPYGKAEDGL